MRIGRLWRAGWFPLLLCCAASAQNMNIRSYKVVNGLPQGQVVSLFRDPQGYMWVGTYSGAARYNGRSWTCYSMDEGLPGAQVTALIADGQGTIWAGTFGQGLARFDGTRFSGFPAGSAEGSCNVNRFALDAQRRLWAATDRGLILHDNGFKVFGPAEGLPSQLCQTVYAGNEGLLYAGFDRGLIAMRNGRLEPLPFQAAFEGRDVRVIAEDQDRRLWVGTSKGLYYVEGRQVFKVEHPILEESNITSAAMTDEDGIWFGTWGQGAFKLVGGQVTQTLTIANGLASNTVYALFYDEEYSLWLGTDSGLNKYRPSEFVSLTAQHGLRNTFCRALCLDHQGNVWVGTRDGVFTIDEQLQVRELDTRNFPSRVVFAIAAQADGTMVVVLDVAVALVKDGKARFFGENVGLKTNALRTVLVDRKHRIWIGGDGLMQLDQGQFVKMPADHPLASVRTYDLVENDDGTLWAGTRDGLVRFDPETRKTYVPSGSKVALWDLARDPKGGLWLGTNGKGLWHYHQDVFKVYDTKTSEIGDDFVWNVLVARNGDLWLGHNRGIDHLQQGQFTHYSMRDGLVDDEAAATAVLQDKQGRVFFGSGEGISIYLPRTVSLPDLPPRVVVEAVTAADRDGQERLLARGEQLDHRHNNLNFRFAGLSFVHEEKLRFAYLLEGQDNKWSESTNLNEVRYMNLVPKAYVFRVKACNPGASWSEGAAFPFVIAPAFYQTLWFEVVVVLLAVALVLVYVRARLLGVQRRNQELEMLVQQRTEALAEKGREFRELALMDPLTRVRNRRFVVELMREEMGRLKRHHFRFRPGDPYACLAVVLLDLDHFKSVNDTYGHDVGDRILVETAERLMADVRGSDVVARWGGEEFLILLREVHPDDLPGMVQKLIERVRSEPFEIDQRSLSCTVSAGFAYLHPNLIKQDVPWEWVLKLADIALYRAKAKGRDRAYGVNFNEALDPAAWLAAAEGELGASLDGGALRIVAV